MRGWRGNQTSLSEKQVLAKILILKSTEECPDMNALYKINNSILLRKLDKNLTSPVYIRGQCCQYQLPSDAPRSSYLEYFVFDFEANSYNNKNVQYFKMMLFDRKTSYLIDQFNTDGPEVTVSMKENVFTSYKLKISRTLHLEGDPSYDCLLYEAGEYERCLQSEHVRQFQDLLGCTPPWAASVHFSINQN